MEFKGTKGKWSYAVFSGDNNCTIYALGNKCLVSMLPKDFSMCTKEETEKEKKEQRYNALLISKAPEMLEFLTQLRYACENGLIQDLEELGESTNKLIKSATEL